MAVKGDYDDFFAAVRQRESGGNYKVVNSYGYLGAYQFGEAALIDLGYVVRDNSIYDNVFNAGFTGKGGIDSRQKFLDSPFEQDAAATAWFALLWSRIRYNDLEFYDGQTLNGVLLTKSGMIAASHLVGTGGLMDFIRSGGTKYQKDAYGTSIVDYLKLFASYETPSSFLNNLEKANTLKGGTGSDVLFGAAGNDTIDGSAGIDVASYAGLGASARITVSNGTIVVTTPSGGTDTLTSIERLAFEDGTIALDLQGNAGKAYRLYQAAFDRLPDADGLGFWIRKLDAGTSNLNTMSASFIGSDEFRQTYGSPSTVSNANFLKLIYGNVLDRTPDDGGMNYWMGQLDRGLTRAGLLEAFSESPENQTKVAADIAGGIWYV